ncbi:MAG: hypothetical protein H6811_09625 [Phycisphaeraceae bacterium]|nr:hypothetical protein [Phycisphaeraceae bacterium]
MPRALAAITALALCTAAHSQVILIGSWADHSVKRLDVTPGMHNAFLSPFVPSRSGGLSTPDGLAWGADRNLYVSSSDTGQVLRFHGHTGEFLGVFASGINQPGNLRFGPDGLLYVCEKGASRVIRLDPDTGAQIDVFAQAPQIAQPVGLEWRNGVLYVADFANARVVKYNAQTRAFQGVLVNIPGRPLILRVGPDDNLWVSAHMTSDISVVDPATGAVLRTINQSPIFCPVGHVLADDGTTIVASWQNHRILRYNTESGAFIEVIAFNTSLLQLPNDLLFTIEQCLADLTGSGDPNNPEYGAPDGATDADDFFFYLDAFAAGDAAVCDLDADGDCDADDFFMYLDLFAAGCP